MQTELAAVGGKNEKKLNLFSSMGTETIQVVKSCLFQMYLLVNLRN